MKDPLHWVAIKYKLALTFVLLALVSLGTGGGVAYLTAKDALRDQIFQRLCVSTGSRAEEVSAFLDTLKKRTVDFSSDGFIRDTVRDIQDGDSVAVVELNRHLQQNKVAIVPDFFETLLVGKSGRVLASSIPANVGLDVSQTSSVRGGKAGVFLGDIHDAGAESTRPSMEVSAPLTDKGSGAFIGVIVNRVKAESVSRVVVAPTAVGSDSGQGVVPGDPDYYLVNPAGLFVSGSRLLDFKETFLRKTVPASLGAPKTGASTPCTDPVGSVSTVATLLDVTAAPGLRKGYRGTEVISAWKNIPGTSWTLISEVDAGQAFQPVTVLRNRLGVVGLVLVAMTATLLFFPSKFMIGPIQRLRDAARRIEKGEFNVVVPVDSDDEIGELARAFNQMAAGLQVRGQIEKRLYQHEKMMVIGELSAAFAHELNTPLASIAMFSQMLIEDSPVGSPRREHLEVILKNVMTCEKTVSSLLGNTGKGRGERTAIDVNECLEEVVAMCRPLIEGHGIGLELDLAKNLGGCIGNKERLCQVFVNLAMNAIQAMEGGGTLLIHSRISWLGGTESIEVGFHDTGEGVSTEDMEQIFEPFFTTKPEGVGTGLGLPIARRVIEEHGGRIEVTASSPGGSSFVVTLPADPAGTGDADA